MNATEQNKATAPVDLELMREAVNVLLDPVAVTEKLLPAATDLNTVTTLLRGHLQLLIPEVERAAVKQPKDGIPRYCALACVGEARGKLEAQPSPRFGGALGYARRLARVLNALCDHYQQLGGEPQ